MSRRFVAPKLSLEGGRREARRRKPLEPRSYGTINTTFFIWNAYRQCIHASASVAQVEAECTAFPNNWRMDNCLRCIWNLRHTSQHPAPDIWKWRVDISLVDKCFSFLFIDRKNQLSEHRVGRVVRSLYICSSVCSNPAGYIQSQIKMISIRIGIEIFI